MDVDAYKMTPAPSISMLNNVMSFQRGGKTLKQPGVGRRGQGRPGATPTPASGQKTNYVLVAGIQQQCAGENDNMDASGRCDGGRGVDVVVPRGGGKQDVVVAITAGHHG